MNKRLTVPVAFVRDHANHANESRKIHVSPSFAYSVSKSICHICMLNLKAIQVFYDNSLIRKSNGNGERDMHSCAPESIDFQ